MSTGKLEVISIIPGPKNVARFVQRFGQNEYGIVTSLNDAQLPMLRSQLDDKTLVDVKSFGEVVRQVHLLTGKTPRRIATSRQILSALAIVCSELGSGSIYRKVAEMPGFHEALLEVFREVNHWGLVGVHQEAIRNFVRQHPEQVKVSELLEIFDQVLEILERANATVVARLIDECLDSTIDSDGQDSRIQIFMGSTVHPMAITWIRWLVSEGADVQVILDRHATDGDIFLLSRLIADQFDAKVIEPGEGNRLINNLFAKSEHLGADLDWVEVHCCGDPLAECEWALRKCLEVGDFGKTAIFARTHDLYGPLLLHAGDSLGVPIESRRRIPLLASGFAKITLMLLEILAKDDVRLLSEPLATSYFGIGEVMDMLARVHEASGNDWDLLRATLSEQEGLEEYIVQVLEHLLNFRVQALDRNRDAAAWHAELKTFLETAPWLDNAQERDIRAQTSLLSNLAQDASIQLVRNPEPISFQTWLVHARGVWDLSDVSVPHSGEGVLLVSNPEELGEIDTLIVLGMLEGAFPRRRSENPILNDDLKERISSVLPNPPLNTSFDIARSERDLFYRVCASPSKGLYFSYPMSDGESDNVPAFYLAEISRICGIGLPVVHPRRYLTPPADECVTERDKALVARMANTKLLSVDNEVKEPEAVEIVRFDMHNVEPRSMRSMLECNFKFAAERLLPKQQQSFDHWGWMLEIPRRANLLRIPDPRAARAEMDRVLNEYMDELRPRLPAWEFDMIYHGAPRLLDGLIEREFHSRELWGRNPANTSVGLNFSDPRLNPVRFGYHLRGTIDGLTDDNGVRTLHLYRRTPPKDAKEDSLRRYLAEYGLYIAAAWEEVREVRIEIDGLAEHRTTLLFSEFQTLGREGEQYLVLNLAKQWGSKKELADDLKDLLRIPKHIATSGQMTARPGDHCQFCSYSDLCRQAPGSADDFFEVGGVIGT